MGFGDLLTQQLKVLAEAAGDPAQLALATVDLAHPSLSETERNRLKAGLEAAAVPHWVDEPLLGAMIGASVEESTQQLARLRSLRVIEPFPARGFGAVNVHQASRRALREKLRKQAPERFVVLSANARVALLVRKELVCRIEALYHLFAIDQEAAATEWERIDREIIHPVEKETLAAALDELLAEGWLTNTGKAVALIARGYVRLNNGEYPQIEAPAREAIALAEQAGREGLMAFAQCLLGEVLAARADTKEAAALFRSELVILERLRRRDPRLITWRREIAVAHSKIADVQEDEGQIDGALKSMRNGLAMLKKLLKENPGDVDLQREVAASQARVADLLHAQSKDGHAIRNYRLALATYAQLTKRDPTNSDWQRDLANAHLEIGSVLAGRNEAEGALQAFRNALPIFERVAELDPTNADVQRSIAISQSWLGTTLRDLGKPEEAMPYLEKYVAILGHLSAEDERNASLLRDLATGQCNLAITAAKLGRTDEAQKVLRTAEEQMLRAIEMAPTVTKWREDLANIRSWIENPPG